MTLSDPHASQSSWRRLLSQVWHEARPRHDAPPLPLAGEGWGGGSLSSGTRGESPHPPRFARHPPPQAGEGSLQRHLPVFAVGEAGFFQIEIAFDPPPNLVGNLAVAQQYVDEL